MATPVVLVGALVTVETEEELLWPSAIVAKRERTETMDRLIFFSFRFLDFDERRDRRATVVVL